MEKLCSYCHSTRNWSDRSMTPINSYRLTTATQRRRIAEQRDQLDRKAAIIARLGAQLARCRGGQGVAR